MDEGKKLRRFFSSIEGIVAALALAVSGMSAIVTYSAIETDKFYKELSVTPVVSFEYRRDGSIYIQNAGLGPAILKQMIVELRVSEQGYNRILSVSNDDQPYFDGKSRAVRFLDTNFASYADAFLKVNYKELTDAGVNFESVSTINWENEIHQNLGILPQGEGGKQQIASFKSKFHSAYDNLILNGIDIAFCYESMSGKKYNVVSFVQRVSSQFKAIVSEKCF